MHQKHDSYMNILNHTFNSELTTRYYFQKKN